MRYFLPILVLGWMLLVLPIALLAQDNSESNRKVISRAPAQYPFAARSMHLGGIVRMEAVVAPNGALKNVLLRGGPPILTNAALDAVSKWRWAPAPRETHEPVIIKFDPDR